jgi:predicted SAM-dependent methyltransferase
MSYVGNQLKLYFGCGKSSDMHSEGYKNVDIMAFDHVDYCLDVSNKLPFDDNSVDEIYAESIFEHIGHMLPRFTTDGHCMENSKWVLCEWRRVLKKGGKLLMKVPNLECILAKYTHGGEPLKNIINWIYGGCIHEFQKHLAGFDKTLMEECLIDAGFTEFVFKNGQYHAEDFLPKHNDEMLVIATK